MTAHWTPTSCEGRKNASGTADRGRRMLDCKFDIDVLPGEIDYGQDYKSLRSMSSFVG